eukprot:911861-Pyramimonas_sp.AAC.1
METCYASVMQHVDAELASLYQLDPLDHLGHVDEWRLRWQTQHESTHKGATLRPCSSAAARRLDLAADCCEGK